MYNRQENDEVNGLIFNIQHFSVNDGPGIRTLVFLKGCPLSCIWCSNPESQSFDPEILFNSTRCIGCGNCINTCPEGAAYARQQGERDKLLSCRKCLKCVDSCNTCALSMMGTVKTAREVFNEIYKDRVFYSNSGGGVTLSGGEPLMQPYFAREIFRLSREAGFSTCVETSGFVSWESFEQVLPYLDLILFDIKHMDEEEHIKCTGVSNKLIQENLYRLVANYKNIRIRFPLIPGYNNSRENIRATAERMNELNLKRLDLLPYHELGKNKYKGLVRDYMIKDAVLLDTKEVEAVNEELSSYGLDVQIAG